MGDVVSGGRKCFRDRLRAGEFLLGTFIKTPAPQVIEVLAGLGFDFVVVDAEHSPFGRESIELAMLATRASGIDGIIRVMDASPAGLLSALDCGAAGIIVPHVATVERARDVAAACRYRGGKRGFANTTRAGRYGATPMWEHVEASDASATVIVMIEDPEALHELEAIAEVEGIDGYFIGRGDLTVSLGARDMSAPEVRSVVERIAGVVRGAGKRMLALAAAGKEAEWLRGHGVTSFVVSSDHGFMRQGAMQALADFGKRV
jgi:2-keto-3-deoxy-L-rhamnonate aldolase RhmA